MCLTSFQSLPGGVLFPELLCPLWPSWALWFWTLLLSRGLSSCHCGLCRELGKEPTELLYFSRYPCPLQLSCVPVLTLLFFFWCVSEAALLPLLPSCPLPSEGLTETERPANRAADSTQETHFLQLSGQLGTNKHLLLLLFIYWKRRYSIKCF